MFYVPKKKQKTQGHKPIKGCKSKGRYRKCDEKESKTEVLKVQRRESQNR